MNRRSFLTAAAASIFVPQFGRFFRQGSGHLYLSGGLIVSRRFTMQTMDEMNRMLKEYYGAVYSSLYATETPLRAMYASMETSRPMVFGVRA